MFLCSRFPLGLRVIFVESIRWPKRTEHLTNMNAGGNWIQESYPTRYPENVKTCSNHLTFPTEASAMDELSWITACGKVVTLRCPCFQMSSRVKNHITCPFRDWMRLSWFRRNDMFSGRWPMRSCQNSETECWTWSVFWHNMSKNRQTTY